MAFEVSHQVQNSICLISLIGNFTIQNIDEVKAKTAALFDHSYNGYVISLKDVGLIDSSGMGWIANSFTQHKRQQIELVICSLSSTIKQLFMYSNLDKVINVYPTEVEALHSFEVE